MKKSYLILFIGALLLSACFPFGRNRAPMMPGPNWWSNENLSSNGESIYFSATNDQGERIPYTGGPSFGGMMMGSQVTCASCHGANGSGGTHTMHMGIMDAPDIRFQALSGESDEHDDGHDDQDDGHAEEHTGYDLETFQLAVVEGKHPNGEPLDRDMPRWYMDDDDLADLFEFIISLE
jgi:hypothetical protein